MSAVDQPPESGAINFPERDPQLFLDLTKGRLDAQLSIIDSVDNKLGMLISLGSALMGILVAVFAVRGSQKFGASEYAVLSVSGACYLTVAALTTIGYFGRKWDIGPALDEVWEDLYKPGDDDLLKWRLAVDYWHYYRSNGAAQRLKAKVLPWVLGAVILQTLTLAAALGLVAAGG
jgi:hypothetical protein